MTGVYANSVTADVVIGTDRRIESVTALEGQKAQQASAVAAMKQNRFIPVLIDGNPRTLERWEQGRSKPNDQAAALILLVRKYPERFAGSRHWRWRDRLRPVFGSGKTSRVNACRHK